MSKHDKTVIALLMVILGLMIIVLYYRFSPSPAPGTDGTESSGTPWHGKQAIEHQTEVKHIEIPGIDTLYLKAGQTEQQVNLYNPDANDCSICFTLFVDDKLVWKSGKCQPGYGFYEIELEHPLEAGTYKGTLLHECERDGQQLNSAKMNLEIVVE